MGSEMCIRDRSYGVQVAKLAGLPQAAVTRARDVLTRLETDHDSAADKLGGLPLFTANVAPPQLKESEIEKILERVNPNELSPRDALDLLFDLKEKLGRDS